MIKVTCLPNYHLLGDLHTTGIIPGTFVMTSSLQGGQKHLCSPCFPSRRNTVPLPTKDLWGIFYLEAGILS